MLTACRKAFFDGVPDIDFDLGARQAVDFLDAGGRGDVDFGQVVADHVDADEDQPALGKRRADGGADFLLAGGQGGHRRLSAGMKVGPRLAVDGDAADRARRFAVDQDDALVALADCRQVGLGDDRLAVELGEGLQHGREVFVVGLEVEDPGAAVTEQGLEDDVLVLVSERGDFAGIGGDQGRRHERREAGDEELFRGVADMRRIVDHQGLWVDMLE